MKRWKILNEDTIGSTKEEIIKLLLENRGIKNSFSTENFLSPKLETITQEAVGIDTKEVEKTIVLIKKTIKENKGIIIYGDYDVDGICGTAILWETIFSFYKNVYPYIPHRIDEGYGLSIAGIENCKKQNKDIGLIITVDNGIVAEKPVQYAKKEGIRVVISDHHTKGKTLPLADAVIHTTELCGAGVAYLLSTELRKEFNIPMSNVHLELVALATVADLVPLHRHNRTFLKHGIMALRETKREGLLALFAEGKVDNKFIDTYQIGHIIAPRLNASGRISHALDSLRLICTTNKTRALELAKLLHNVNQERQSLTIKSSEHAKASVIDRKGDLENLIFVSDQSYEQGVVGLIASRLVEEFYRPSIAVSIGGKVSKGSARSIPGVNIIELIRSVPGLDFEAGGHPMAAGFSIDTEKLDTFEKELVKKAKEIKKELFDRLLSIDLELSFSAISTDLYYSLQALSPFGMGNPTPLFMTKAVSIASLSRVGKEGNHLQVLFEKDGDFFKGIQFNLKNIETFQVGEMVNIAYTIELNEWRGSKNIQLKIRDMQKIA
ncbi:MAG: single-stranded-DNA-specific exonuclease RecJ [Candidatus Levybacteria bacterium]|nr:single-stranded-DNA-specific exonuclease RecJ [Candidatus Levybacteria bacterium]MBP9815280.1 single-stranded-DNA-specific exonuclease RecJ [Candidatus Levybacteria bacterium]